MSRTSRYFQRKALEKIPSPLMDVVGKSILKGIDKAVENRWDRAVKLASEAPGVTVEQKVDHICKDFRRELATVGAASGAVAAAPGVGTATAAGALVADVGWFGMRATDLIMAIGAAYGYTNAPLQERRAWVLSVMAHGEDAAARFASLAAELSSEKISGQTITGSARADAAGAKLLGLAGGELTFDALRQINASLASKVVAKYGSRRGVLMVGKLLPFGIGAAVGGTANYGLVRAVGNQTRRFFDQYAQTFPDHYFPDDQPNEIPAKSRVTSGTEPIVIPPDADNRPNRN